MLLNNYIVAGRILYTRENTLNGKAYATSRVQTLMWESQHKPVHTIYVIFMYGYIHRGNIKWNKALNSCSFFEADLFQEAILRSQSGLFGAQVAQTIGERSLPAEGAVRATALVNRDALHIVWECVILTGQENHALTRWGPRGHSQEPGFNFVCDEKPPGHMKAASDLCWAALDWLLRGRQTGVISCGQGVMLAWTKEAMRSGWNWARRAT